MRKSVFAACLALAATITGNPTPVTAQGLVEYALILVFITDGAPNHRVITQAWPAKWQVPEIDCTSAAVNVRGWDPSSKSLIFEETKGGKGPEAIEFDLAEVEEIGHFNGTYFIAEVTHTVQSGCRPTTSVRRNATPAEPFPPTLSGVDISPMPAGPNAAQRLLIGPLAVSSTVYVASIFDFDGPACRAWAQADNARVEARDRFGNIETSYLITDPVDTRRIDLPSGLAVFVTEITPTTDLLSLSLPFTCGSHAVTTRDQQQAWFVTPPGESR